MKPSFQVIVYLLLISVASAIEGSFSPPNEGMIASKSLNDNEGRANKINDSCDSSAEASNVKNLNYPVNRPETYELPELQKTPLSFSWEFFETKKEEPLFNKTLRIMGQGFALYSCHLKEFWIHLDELKILEEGNKHEPGLLILDIALLALLQIVLVTPMVLVQFYLTFVLDIVANVQLNPNALLIYCVAVLMIAEGQFLRHSKAKRPYVLLCCSLLLFNQGTIFIGIFGLFFLFPIVLMPRILEYTYPSRDILKERWLNFKNELLGRKDDSRSLPI